MPSVHSNNGVSKNGQVLDAVPDVQTAAWRSQERVKATQERNKDILTKLTRSPQKSARAVTTQRSLPVIPLSDDYEDPLPENTLEEEHEPLIAVSGPTEKDLEEAALFYRDAQEESDIENDLSFFFGRITVPDLLSREEELALAKEIVAKANAWRSVVLSESFGQSRALSLYNAASIAGANEMLRMLKVRESDTAERVEDDLSRLLPQFKRLVAQNVKNAGKKIGQLLQGQVPKHERDSKTDTLVQLMESRKLTEIHVEKILRDLERLLESLEKYEAHWEKPNRCPELVRLISQNAVWPAQLQQTVAQAKLHHGEWKVAREKMVLANTRLAVPIAQHYRTSGLPYIDLLGLGVLGVIRAIDKYEPERGFKFGTYATWWVRHCIQKGIAEQAKTIRIPPHQIQPLVTINAFSQQYAEAHGGYEPSYTVIGEGLGMDPTIVEKILRANCYAASIDTVIGDDDTPLGNFIPDAKAPNTFSCAEGLERSDSVHEALRSLTRVERMVINFRFGLGLSEVPQTPDNPEIRFIVDDAQYGKPLTLQEVANTMNLTRERVRQIQAKALGKLRNADHPLRYSIAAHQEQENDAVPRKKVASFGESNGYPRLHIGWTETGVGTKIADTLERQGLYTVADYLGLTEEERSTIPYIGKTSIRTIEEAVARLGIERNGVHS